MATLLAKNAEILVTMDGQRRELMNAGVYVEVIETHNRCASEMANA